MKINDMIVLLPVSIITTALKFARFDLNSEDKKFIAENHLYHCVSSKEVADNIIKSGYLRPATGALKTINSYGHASVCLFGGIPNTDNFMKNLNVNLYTQPDKIINAVEICIHEDELNKNYKSRKVSDEAILYEGYCVLPQDRTRAVQLVMDLKRDENGVPLLGNNGRPAGFEMRKRTLDEINRSPDEYRPRQDYLDYVKEIQKEYGMSTKEDIVHSSISEVAFLGRVGNMEGKEIIRSTKKNLGSILSEWKNSIRDLLYTKKIDENADAKIERLSRGRAYLERKNPYDDPKFALAVTKFGYEGIVQSNLEETLQDFANSENGKYLRDKFEQLDNNAIHGRKMLMHAKRTTLLANIIAEKEGIFAGDDADRKRDILAYAAFYKDIGRNAGLITSARQRANYAKKIEMRELDGKLLSETDKKIVTMLIEGCGTKEDKTEKLLKKYQVPEEEQSMVKLLLNVVRDADALDRARLTKKMPFSTKTNLNPEYLRLRSSKGLMDVSYGLEFLSENVKSFRDILNYKNKEPGKHYQTIKRRKEKENFLKKFTPQGEQTKDETTESKVTVIEKNVDRDDDNEIEI